MTDTIGVLKSALPDLDEDTLEYMGSMLDDYNEDSDEGLLEFMEDYGHSGAEAAAALAIIKKKLGLGGAPEEEESDHAQLLAAPVIMAQEAEKQEEQIKTDARALLDQGAVNVNATMESFVEEEDKRDMSVEEMIARAKAKKKEARRERKQLRRERNIAPVRTAMLESLTQKPVVIHSMLGEDGSYGGSPCVDIMMREFSIDLAGMPILEDANLTLVYGRKYGLIGRNGVGKTTFLKHLSSKAIDGIPWWLQILHIEQEVAESDITPLDMVLETDEERATLMAERQWLEDKLAQDEHFGTFRAKKDLDAIPGDERFVLNKGVDPITRMQEVYERLEEIDADLAPSKAATILSGLSFTQEMMRKPLRSFSGGWRMRVSLARALFIEPDVLLLDEPTNHLDLHAVLWLEEYLKSYENTVVIVSHARGFLNEVCTDILLMKDQKINRYKGNYDQFEETRHQKEVMDERQRESQEKKRSELESFIKKNIGGNSKGASMAKSRQKMLEKMAFTPSKSIDPTVRFKFPNPGPVSGGFGIRLVGVAYHYPDAPILFTNVDFSINQNSRICLVGPNGIGKSTLLKIVYEELRPTEGLVTRNQRLRVGRFSQHQVEQLQSKKSSLEQFQSDYPSDPLPKIRKHLANFGVQGGLQVRPINTLSGGQKSRVALAMITYNEPHLLLLDEPTNHLDLDTVQALIQALSEYKGGVMIVSHDEHLITAVCDELWIIQNKKVDLSRGNFQDYKEQVQESFRLKKRHEGAQ
eukprot:m.36125 g.36125  ORF g.36125 m.36125 type:complete len:754 (+) comp9967_c1_seq3:98-2359(+)